GGAVLMLILTIVFANPLSPKGQSITANMMGIDFTAFYAGGSFVNQGRYYDLYDINAVYVYEQNLGKQYQLDLKTSVGPWWNPPFYAWVFVPLAKLPFPLARDIWIAFNFTCLLAAIWLMTLWLPNGSSWKTWALVPLLVLVSMPVVQALTHGQNSPSSLL